MSLPRNSEFEKIKAGLFSHIIKNSVLPRAKALNEDVGQKAIAALENFLFEAFCCIREDVLLEYLLPKSLAPEILREERKVIQPGTSKIGVVTVGSLKNKSGSSQGPGVPIPILKLCGTYLERTGFDIGAQVGVFLGEKELILRPGSGCDDGSDQSAGVANG